MESFLVTKQDLCRSIFSDISLLIGVVNRHWHVVARVLIKPLAGLQHPVLKERFSLVLVVVVAVRRRYQFLNLGDEHRLEQFRIYIF